MNSKGIRLTVAVLVSIFLVLIFGYFYYFLSEGALTKVFNQELYALKKGNFNLAYSLTSTDFQNNTSLEAYKKFVDQYSALKNNAVAQVVSQSITNDTGIINGVLKSQDGVKLPVEFHFVKENNVWKILSINVKLSGIASKPSQDLKQPVKVNQAPPAFSLTGKFESKNAKYTIRFPSDWGYVQPNQSTVVFKGNESSLAALSTVNIQVVLTKKAGGNYSNIVEFMNDLKKQFVQQSPDATFSDEKDLTLKEDAILPGKSITVTYSFKGQHVKQWQIIIPRKDGLVFYTWAYTSSLSEYDTFLGLARSMLESWNIF